MLSMALRGMKGTQKTHSGEPVTLWDMQEGWYHSHGDMQGRRGLRPAWKETILGGRGKRDIKKKVLQELL